MKEYKQNEEKKALTINIGKTTTIPKGSETGIRKRTRVISSLIQTPGSS